MEPARFLCPWDFPGKNTGVGYHFLLQGNLPDPGIEPESLASPTLAGRLFPAEQSGRLSKRQVSNTKQKLKKKKQNKILSLKQQITE